MKTPVNHRHHNSRFDLRIIHSLWLLLSVIGCGGPEPKTIEPTDNRRVQDEFKPGDSATNSIGMKLTYIPAGEFRMGSPYEAPDANDDEEPHEVQISMPFYIGTAEVTQGEYEKIMGNNPSHFQKRVIRETDSSQYPVESVSWGEANEFCRSLSSLPEEIAAGRVYRLPTEAEWEYACRAGSVTSYSFGDDAESLNHYAWCRDSFKKKTRQSEAELLAAQQDLQHRQRLLDDKITDLRERSTPRTGRSRITDLDSYSQNLQRNVLRSDDNPQRQAIQDATDEREKLNKEMRELLSAHYTEGRPHPCRQKKPNSWGLYDMQGNVREFCQDFYAAYPTNDLVDPQGPTNGKARVVRGGSYNSWRADCRAAGRRWTDKTDEETGFRVVMVKEATKGLDATKKKMEGQADSGITAKSTSVPTGFVAEKWASDLGCLSGVTIGPGGAFGTNPYVYQVQKQAVVRVTGRDSAASFAIGFPPARQGRIVFDAGKGSGSFQGDMLVSAPLMGGGDDLIYRVNQSGVATVFFSSRLKLTKGIALGLNGQFGLDLYAINTTRDCLLSIAPSGSSSNVGSRIVSHFADDDLIITSDREFGQNAYITDEDRGKLLRMPRSGPATDFANIPAAMSIAKGEGAFGNFLYVGTAEGKVFRVSAAGEVTLFLKEIDVPPDADIRGIDVENDQMWLATDAGTLLRVTPSP